MSQEVLLEDLNPPQRQAVEYRGGPLMVLAGAGSGKTRVITYRIAHLLASREAHPWNILAVTFTNKAAREMRERVWALLRRQERDLWVSTFHAACARILRGHAHLLGYERDFVIYDDRDQVGVVETCVRELNLDPKRFAPRMLLSRIRAAKQQYLTPDEVASSAQGDYLEERVGRVYQRYQEQLRRAQSMDFDDLLFHTLLLFSQHPEILEYYRQRWRHVLVDEFQDTNHIQYRIVRALSEVNRNICVVGDDDQSIYSWRGADLGNILGFERDFPGAWVIRLEQNYRSTQTILDASGAVIQQNRARKGKRLWTENGPGEPLQIYHAVDERDEAIFVAEEIRDLVKREGLQPGDMAVFYRVHAQSRVLEEELLHRQLPFAIYGGLGFYERKEIKDVVAYLRASIHPEDDMSWRRILNTPHRGIGRTTVRTVEAMADQEGVPFSMALRRYVEPQKRRGGPVARVREFLEMMDRLSLQVSGWGVGEAVGAVLEETGYLAELQTDADLRAKDRMENIQELLNLVKEYETEYAREGDGLVDFLERIALVSDVDRMHAQADLISLMTLHAAKGLEFPVIFIVGLEENLFPHSLSVQDTDELEEERRLFYVGMTRAQRWLYLTYAAKRRIWGEVRHLQPSRFLREIPEGYLQACSPGAVDFAESRDESEGLGIYAGRWVRHRAFGVGTVQRLEENDTRVVIYFPGVGEKRFLVKEAPLEWL